MSDIEDMLSVPEPKVDTERALARLRARVESERITPATRMASPPRRPAAVSGWLKGLSAAATVALVATVLTMSGLAETILTIFEPKQIVAVPITSADLNGASSFDAYGTLTWTEQPRPYDVPDIRTAARESGMTVLVPSNVPAGVGAPRYGVMPKTTATFTFSAEKARQAAAAQRRTPPPMPANMDGSKLFITGGPAVVTFYGDAAPTGATGATGASPFSGMPKLIVAQGKPPLVQSDGVTVDELQRYLLQQPGISPQLAAQIRAIKDPSTTLPVPIPVDMTTSKKVTVQGVEGIFVGDSTGLGSAVIWQKDGIVYGVAGTLTEQEVLAVANSLR